MKHNPVEEPIRERMRPGVLSREGFLGRDNRTIAEIVDDDEATVRKADLTLRQVADLLEEIHEAVEGTMGRKQALFEGKIQVQEDEAMGGIPCPFGCGHKSHKAMLTIEMPDRTLTITPLHAHMIREHGFFEGRGASMRLEPKDVIDLYQLCRSD